MLIYLTRLKTLLRQKGILFWTFIFPIALAGLEFAAFGKLSYQNPLDTVNIGLIEEVDYRIDETLESVFKTAKIDDNKNLYNIFYYSNINIAREKLNNDDVMLVVYQEDGKTQINCLESNMYVTVTQSIIKQTKSVTETIKNAYVVYYEELAKGNNPKPVNPEKIIESMTAEFDYYEDLTRSTNANPLTIYFYSLIAMACLYAAFWGSSIINDIRADQSNLGIRISVSPTSKYKLIGLYFLAAMTLQLISSVLTFVFIRYILGVMLGDNVLLILITMILGSMLGICMGMFFHVIIKGSSAKKESIVSIVTLVLSAMAGLMAIEVKHFINQYLPFINYLNPAALITDALYQLYYYDTYTQYIITMALIVGLSLIFLAVSIFKMRGEKYASL